MLSRSDWGAWQASAISTNRFLSGMVLQNQYKSEIASRVACQLANNWEQLDCVH